MLVASWPLEANMYEGEATAGPVPTFFTEDQEAAKEAMTTNPARTHKDYQRIIKAFFMPELVQPGEAVQIVRKPRYILYII